jgi:hypothetical protein
MINTIIQLATMAVSQFLNVDMQPGGETVFNIEAGFASFASVVASAAIVAAVPGLAVLSKSPLGRMALTAIDALAMNWGRARNQNDAKR